MNKEVKHTPLSIGGHSGKMVFNNLGTQIANCGTQEEAHMFVKCMNMHDELVEALRLLLSNSYDYQTGVAEAEETLKKAGAL